MAVTYTLERDDKSVDWFLDTVVVRDIEKVIDAGAGYLAFALIAQAIELLGALLDEQDFCEIGLSEDRFARAIDTLFEPINKDYARYNKSDSDYYLWKFLRCGMAHVFRPGNRIVFTGADDARKMELSHLQVSPIDGYEGDQLVLVIEKFFADLKDACRRAKNVLKKKTHPKLKQGYITVAQYNFEFYNSAKDVTWPVGTVLSMESNAQNPASTIYASITGAGP